MSARVKAFLIHGLSSVVVAICSMLLIFCVWYPVPLNSAVGVATIFFMMLAIDVIIGPLMTLLVYKQGKKTLVFDLSVIVLLQLSAFTYGLYTMAQGRPAWLVYNADRFDIVRVNELDERKRDEAKPEYMNPPWFGPQWVAAVTPVNTDARNQVVMESVFAGVDIAQRPNLYVHLDTQKVSITKHLKNMDELKKFNKEVDIENLRKKYPKADSWLPLKGLVKDMVVLMSKENAQPVKIVDLRPWE